MKKLLCGMALLLVVLAAAPSIQADPAIVLKNDGLCGIPGADADGDMIFGGIGTVTTIVENDNKVMIKCKGSGITNDSGRGQKFTSFLCGIVAPSGGFVTTDDTHAAVSASGVGTLTCTYEKP